MKSPIQKIDSGVIKRFETGMTITWTDFYVIGTKVLLSMNFPNILKDIGDSETENFFLINFLVLFLWNIIVFFQSPSGSIYSGSWFRNLSNNYNGTSLFILFMLLFKVKIHHLAFTLIKASCKMIIIIKQNDEFPYCPLNVSCSLYVALFRKIH